MKCFLILADEMRDVTSEEQLVLVVCFYYNHQLEESFLCVSFYCRNPKFWEYFKSSIKSTKYASPLVQKDIIDSVGNVIWDAILLMGNLDLLKYCEHIDLCNTVLKELGEADFPSFYGKAVQTAESVWTPASLPMVILIILLFENKDFVFSAYLEQLHEELNKKHLNP